MRENDIIKNRFTKYVTKAFIRCKARYLSNKNIIICNEVPFDSVPEIGSYEMDFTECGNFTFDYISDDNLLRAILLLSKRDQKILYLKVFKEFSYQEIAAILSMKPDTVKTTFSKIRSKIKRLMEGK